MASGAAPSLLRRLLDPPTYPSEELTERARLLHSAVWVGMILATTVLGALIVVQPEAARRSATSLIAIDAVGIGVLALSRLGYPKQAGVAAIAILLVLVTWLAPSGGGIRSPAATTYFAFVLLAGVLLGPQAALRTAIACALLATGLVAGELLGLFEPGPVRYGPLGLLVMNLFYVAAIVALTRVAARSMSDALARAESELAERKRGEQERDRLLSDLRERVKELTLLQGVARLLHSRWYFDRSVLSEIVAMMPAGWQYPEHSEARIRYLDQTWATPGWTETPWIQARTLDTSRGHGVIEVAYTREFPPAGEGPFLKEERALLDSLAEMVVGHFEREHVEERRRGLEDQLRQSQKMEALGTLAGGIAHDFNNILTAIGGNVDLALQDTTDESMQGYLHEVKLAHERARDLVKRILVFSRRQEASKRVIALQPVVEEALRLIRASVGHEVRIETDFSPVLPLVLADSTQIHQVLMNLATNAAHAMRESGGTLTVTLDERTTASPIEDGMPAGLQPGRYVRLRMRDTGTGMSREVLDRLYEPFFTTKGVLGTGLGLSVVHGIVHDHGGAIAVESEEGAGTSFELFFPAALEHTVADAPANALPVRGTGQHILYVDDEESVRSVMLRTLDRMGYRASAAAGPNEAIRLVRDAPAAYDAVVSDMGMPGMSGLELAKELRRIRPDLPIAIASGYARPHTTPDEVSAWIHKPPGRVELAETLEAMLRGGVAGPRRNDG